MENIILELTPYQRDVVVAALSMYQETLEAAQREGTYSGITRARIVMVQFLLALLEPVTPA